MNEVTLRVFGLEVLHLSWGTEESDDPRREVDVSGISAADSERAPAPPVRVWGDGYDRPEPIRCGFGT